MDIIFWDLTHSRIFFRLIKFNEKGTLYWKVLSSHNDRSSRSEVFCKNGALRNFTKFTWKRLCQSLSFERLKPATLLKKKLWHRYFSVNFGKFLRTLIFIVATFGKFLKTNWLESNTDSIHGIFQNVGTTFLDNLRTLLG